MTIVVFLIDTSASMNQRAFMGGRPTLLDVAKNAVETFVKVRQRNPDSRLDRYMLLTFEDPPNNIKAGWKENLGAFMNELKNLQSVGMTTMGPALRHAFDVLNINRMQTGIDTYGQGRCPCYCEPAMIVVITDGGKLSTNGGVQEDFNLPMTCPQPGSELTREPFRWDQRLFSLVLRIAGTPPTPEQELGLPPTDNSHIDVMCEVTGGRSYSILSHRMLMTCIDTLVQKIANGVVVVFEKYGPDPPPVERDDEENDDPMNPKNDMYLDNRIIDVEKNGAPWNNGPGYMNPVSNNAWTHIRKLIYVPRQMNTKSFPVSYWPIPEQFRPDINASSLPPRTAHPVIRFTCASQEPMVIDTLPFDKYELEPSPLTQYILARKQPTVCWQVFVANNGKNPDAMHPFGYLKASTNLNCVNLFVMPYNYPVLLPLLDDLFKVHRCKPSLEWKALFQQYVDRMPAYYVTPLKRALSKMGAPNLLIQSLIPDTQDIPLSYTVLNYLKKLKNTAKMEFDKLCNEMCNKTGNILPLKGTESVRVNPRTPLKKDLISHPCLQDKFSALRDQINEFGGFVVGLSRNRYRSQTHSYRNPYDIQRRDLLDQVVRMRANFLQPSLTQTKLIDDDSLHSMPVAQMGNYQEYLKRQAPPLREIESPPVRQHMFGNPFKIDKRMMVDEADIDLVGGGGGNNRLGNKRMINPLSGEMASMISMSPRNSLKRKPGPLPPHFTARRPSTPTMSMIPSPSLLSDSLSTIYNRPPKPMSMWSHQTNGDLALPSLDTGPPLGNDIGGNNIFSQVATYQPQSPVSINTQVKPLMNGDSYLLKQPRSPSPPPPPGLPMFGGGQSMFLPLPMVEDEKQINMILHEASSGKPRSKKINKVQKSPPALSRKEIGEIKRHNLNVRAQVYKAVRKPGRDFSGLFKHLKDLKGAYIMKKEVIDAVIQESLRFKRVALSKLLEEFRVTLERNGNSLSHGINSDNRGYEFSENVLSSSQVNNHN